MAKFIKILEDEIYSRNRALRALHAHAALLKATGATDSFSVKLEGGGGGVEPYRIVLYRK